MGTFIATLGLFGIVVLAMSVGVIVSGKRLKGSCGMTGDDCSCSRQTRANCEHLKEPAVR
jgi:hypothetical protein